MAGQTKRTANDVAALFLEQAVRETRAYLVRMRALLEIAIFLGLSTIHASRVASIRSCPGSRRGG